MYFDLEIHNDAPALVGADGSICSYRELSNLVQTLTARLQARTVVLCLTRNVKNGIAGYLACINSRAVPILFDHQTSIPALLKIIETYRPRFIWTPSSESDAFPGFATSLSLEDYTLLESRAPEQVPLHGDLGLLLTTSGSTGSPKLVRISYQNLLSNTQSIIEYLGLTSSERTITTLPFSYSFGLSVLNSFLHVGGSIVLTDASLLQREFWVAMKQQRVSSLSGVPYTFEMLKRIRFQRMDLPDLKTLTQAGGKLPKELCLEFAEAASAKGIQFFIMYGATEASPRMAYLPPKQAIPKVGSIGIPIPRGSFELVGDNGLITDAQVVGQLIYRGPNVAMGYAESSSDLVKGDEFGGVLMTGDLAFRDDDGYYFVVGRIKRLIKLFGVRTNLDEVEQLVRAEFPNAAVACTGEDNKLVVVLEDESICQVVRDHLTQAMRIAPSAIDVKAIDVIPRSESGKVLYSKL